MKYCNGGHEQDSKMRRKPLYPSVWGQPQGNSETITVSNETWTEVSVIRTRSDTWRIKFKNAACLITRRVMKCHIPGTLIHGGWQNISILTPCTRSISKWHELCTLWCGVSGVLYFLHFDTQSVTIFMMSWHLLLGVSGSVTNCVSTCQEHFRHTDKDW